MSTLAVATEGRVRGVEVTEDTPTVALMDGRSISVPLVWYPRLLHANAAQRSNWQIAGGGYGIHWPEIDEDLSVGGYFAAHLPPARSQHNHKVSVAVCCALSSTMPAISRRKWMRS